MLYVLAGWIYCHLRLGKKYPLDHKLCQSSFFQLTDTLLNLGVNLKDKQDLHEYEFCQWKFETPGIYLWT